MNDKTNAIIPSVFLNPFQMYDGSCCHCVLEEMSENYVVFSRNILVGEKVVVRIFTCSKVEWMLGCHCYEKGDREGRGWELYLMLEYPEYFISQNLN